MRRFFETPGIARTEKIEFLERAWKPRLSRPVYGLMMVLLRRRRLDHLIVIADGFEAVGGEAKGLSRAPGSHGRPARPHAQAGSSRARWRSAPG